MLALNLVLALTLSPPTPAPDYQATLTQLSHANANLNDPPEQTAAALLEALVNLTRFPASVAISPDAQALQSRAQLSLARSYLLLDKPDQAAATTDEAIRTARGRELPFADFGPTLESLYAQRLATLEANGRARLHVTCTIPCRVFVNERETPTLTEPMYLGIYRVWIVDASGKLPPKQSAIRLAADGAQVELSYQPKPTPPANPASLPHAVTPRSRTLPRNVEIAMMALGVGLASVGTWMIGARERTVEGPIVIGLGGVSFLFGSALLVVDEAPGSQPPPAKRLR
ncbi:hypothetical protein [Enhygromyxa salina]|uniref:Uncharacterized protein n=1 Tax=Enhygromyxa salina TaxID=215803 RepID=A0A2S9Y8C0_9BACT|nr:hypothetical protein [Enhygromyxa salina]PRQ01302.1 hypothetical protein ENSA7_59070 [Enhygromyxa salina]